MKNLTSFSSDAWKRLRAQDVTRASDHAHQRALEAASRILSQFGAAYLEPALVGWRAYFAGEMTRMYLPAAVFESAIRRIATNQVDSIPSASSELTIVTQGIENSLATLSDHAVHRGESAARRILGALSLSKEYASRTSCNWSEFEGGQGCRIVIPEGETHRGGMGPVFISDNTRSLVYKPGSGEPSALLGLIVNSHVNPGLSHGIPVSLPVYSTKVGSLYNFVQASNELHSQEAAEAFAYVSGALLAVCFAFRITDVHHENVIVSQGLPVIVDHETVLYRDPLSQSGSPSVLHTGLFDETGTAGLLGKQNLFKSATTLVSRNGPGNERLSFSEPFASTSHCAFYSGNRVLIEDHEDAFVDGFTTAYAQIARKASSILRDASDLISPVNPKIRCIIRATKVYLNLLQWRYQPGDLDDRLNSFRTRLAKHEISGSAIGDCVVASEVKSIVKGDVPYFFGRLCDLNLCDEDGVVEPRFFPTTGLQELEASLRALTVDDCSHQVAEIRRVLDSRRGRRVP